MRFQKQYLVSGLVVLLGLAFVFAGCGSDDETPTTLTGSMTDTEFVAVQTEVGTFVDSTVAFLKNSLSSMAAVETYDEYIDPVFYGPVDPESDVVSTTYENGWHIVSITRLYEDFGMVMRDSIQFFDNDQVSQRGVDSDSLYYIHRWFKTVSDTTVSYNAFVGASNFTCTGLDGTSATINGTHNWMMESKNVSDVQNTWRDIEINASLNDVVVNKTSAGWISGCPTSGTVGATVHMTYKQGDGTPVTSTWTVSLAFNNGNMVATVEMGNYIWSYSGNVCGVSL